MYICKDTPMQRAADEIIKLAHESKDLQRFHYGEKNGIFNHSADSHHVYIILIVMSYRYKIDLERKG